MKPITVVLPYSPAPFFKGLAGRLSRLPVVSQVFVLVPDHVGGDCTDCDKIFAGTIAEEGTLTRILDATETNYLLFVQTNADFDIGASQLERLLTVARAKEAGIVYSDFWEEGKNGRRLHPVNDYQVGSVREGFDFGPLVLASVTAVRESRDRYHALPALSFAGFYDLRLKLSIEHPICRVAEPLATVLSEDQPLGGEGLFSYVDPRNRNAQKEMEQVFTDYLKWIGAYLPASALKFFRPEGLEFPAEASVIIPVKNRKGTIADAVYSAMAQKTSFPFNVIVVDNHSTDGTTDVLSKLAEKYANVRHLIPERTDLCIGGCWNAAIDSEECGRYAVQLDSDDLYSTDGSLQQVVDMFGAGYAVVIGSYTLVDSGLREIATGFVDHREWTEENGHNNALRINGLGAPRAFHTAFIRKVRFPNVSYGEDYSVAIRTCRQFRIGRIFESLYLCRRWAGNTDSSLTVEEANLNDWYKDALRSEEIAARQKKNAEEGLAR